MTRYEVALEGIMSTDGRLIKKGALSWPTYDSIPVLNENRDIVGTASDFQRMSNGRISCDISGVTIPPTTNLHIEVSSEEAEPEGTNYVFSKASIRAIFLSASPSAWPVLNRRRD